MGIFLEDKTLHKQTHRSDKGRRRYKIKRSAFLSSENTAGDFNEINIRFTGDLKYAAFATPDEKALRIAGGKATVSTNDWIQGFGQEDGRVLIRYEITASALSNNASVSLLAFVPQKTEIVRQPAVTDKPVQRW